MTENNKVNIKILIEQLQLIFSIKSGLKFEIYNSKNTKVDLHINDVNKINYKKIFNFKHFIQKDDINKSNIKRIINFSRNFLNNQLILFGIYDDNNKPVLNKWIDYYELLYISRIFDIIKENKISINVFYLDNNKEIFDCTDFKLEVLLKLGELKIEVVKEKRPIRIGKLTVLHGHELFGGSGGVNPARGTFLKTLENVVVGHYHKTSSNTEASMYGDVFSVHSVGCLCGKTPYYMPINKWNTGFAYCELEIKTGNYTFYNLKIINGKIY